MVDEVYFGKVVDRKRGTGDDERDEKLFRPDLGLGPETEGEGEAGDEKKEPPVWDV